MTTNARTPWYLRPFIALWRLATAVESRLGIVRSLLIGAGLTVLGVVFCMTFVGLLIGLPAMAFGIALFTRAVI